MAERYAKGTDYNAAMNRYSHQQRMWDRIQMGLGSMEKYEARFGSNPPEKPQLIGSSRPAPKTVEKKNTANLEVTNVTDAPGSGEGDKGLLNVILKGDDLTFDAAALSADANQSSFNVNESTGGEFGGAIGGEFGAVNKTDVVDTSKPASNETGFNVMEEDKLIAEEKAKAEAEAKEKRDEEAKLLAANQLKNKEREGDPTLTDADNGGGVSLLQKDAERGSGIRARTPGVITKHGSRTIEGLSKIGAGWDELQAGISKGREGLRNMGATIKSALGGRVGWGDHSSRMDTYKQDLEKGGFDDTNVRVGEAYRKGAAAGGPGTPEIEDPLPTTGKGAYDEEKLAAEEAQNKKLDAIKAGGKLGELRTPTAVGLNFGRNDRMGGYY